MSAEREQRHRVRRAALATFGPLLSCKPYVGDETYNSGSTRSTTLSTCRALDRTSTSTSCLVVLGYNRVKDRTTYGLSLSDRGKINADNYANINDAWGGPPTLRLRTAGWESWYLKTRVALPLGPGMCLVWSSMVGFGALLRVCLESSSEYNTDCTSLLETMLPNTCVSTGILNPCALALKKTQHAA